ncbi:OLC1v1037944C1 [Oldenlandia corymbosa var. corymbosa]|uniref:OLC1v1037944C1 n=1 Tax=Oldenlandia corymbosa var. corymbosa TaxID=529605 RepID=A0AAV1D040_OLDCO|nr:OLC1v1037944C1 [Oldenlandia corymbosa var. corymbosa]
MSSTSTEVPAELAEDVTAEILSRLSVKDLLRCKCVSKSWRALISSPNLALTTSGRERAIVGCDNQSISVDSKAMAFYSIDAELSVEKLPYPTGEVPSHYADFMFLASCNGLILFYASKGIYLWNPLTSCCRLLTQFSVLASKLESFYSIASGLWFDKISDVYKVVLVTRTGRPRPRSSGPSVCVASLMKNETKTNIKFPYKLPYLEDDESFIPSSGVLVMGHLHWIVKQQSGKAQLIVYFDEETNQFRKLPMPQEDEYEDGGSRYYYFGLTVLHGCLCMSKAVKMSSEFVDIDFADNDVLIMRDYGMKHSWTKMFTIQGLMVPLHTRISSNLVLVSRLSHFYVYDLEKKYSQKLTVQPYYNNNLRNKDGGKANSEPVTPNIIVGPLSFVESLASVDSM